MTTKRWQIPTPAALDDAARATAAARGLSLARYIRGLVERDTGMRDTTRAKAGRPPRVGRKACEFCAIEHDADQLLRVQDTKTGLEARCCAACFFACRNIAALKKAATR